MLPGMACSCATSALRAMPGSTAQAALQPRPSLLHSHAARQPLFPRRPQANRFPPDDPFTAPADPNEHYNNVDPATGKPSLEIEITMSRK